MYWSISYLIALMSGILLLTLVYFYLFLHYRERYILIWSFSWLAYALSFLFASWFGAKIKSNVLIIFVTYRYHLFALNLISILFSGLFLLWGTYEFIGKKISEWWVYTTLIGIAWIGYATQSAISIRITALPIYTFIGLIYILTGGVILYSYKFEGVGKKITGISFILWGMFKLLLPLLADESWLTPWGYLISGLAPWAFLINMVMTFIAAIGILLIFFNKISLDLSKSEERFRLLAENARDIIYRICLKPKFSIEYISPALTSIIGYEPEYLYNNPKKIYELVYLYDRHLIKKIIKKPTVRIENIRWKHKDGYLVWVEHNNVPIYNNQGNLIAIEGIARDITERKKAEEVLQKYQLLSESARDIILMMQPDGQIIEANKSAIETYGYSRDELLSLNIKDLYTPDTISDFNNNLTKANNPGVIFETLNRCKDRTVFFAEVSLQGTIIGKSYVLLSIVRDITIRKKEEAAIIEARERVARAERLASLGTMAAGIAHEINQPLNSLKVTADGMLYLYNMNKDMELIKIMENIKKISNQAARIDSIIKHMRSFVKNDIPVKKSSCDINRAVESALLLINSQLISHSINLKKDLAEDLPVIEAQNIHLEEIVINLVVNAKQALDKIEKSNKQIICKTYLDKNYLVLEISDNGPGIDENIQKKIFDPYFSNSGSGESMGLGLSIVQSIVKSYAGIMDFKNNNEGGATFTIRFPLSKSFA